MKSKSLIFVFLLLFFSCSKEDTSLINNSENEQSNNNNNSEENNDENSGDNSDNNDNSIIPLSLYEEVYGTINDVYFDQDWVYINTNGMPDHPSPYYLGTQWENDLYLPYDNSNPFVSSFHLNPNRVSELDLLFKIPLNPLQSSSYHPTAMGPIGVALNGVPFYNQYAGGGSPLTQEINSFDQYNGHPAPMGPGQENGSSGKYHYHMEPFWLTLNAGKEALIGFLLDGFPVFGPEENNEILSSSDLDEFHGHFHVKPDFPNGIYHYHVTADDPYLNGSGYYGTPGTVTQ
jgi:hypothetical protein